MQGKFKASNQKFLKGWGCLVECLPSGHKVLSYPLHGTHQVCPVIHRKTNRQSNKYTNLEILKGTGVEQRMSQLETEKGLCLFS